MKFDPVNPLSDLLMKHEGQRICIMGGSKTLDDDLRTVEADVWISVNNHGAMRREVDYIVCMDNIHTANKREMWKFLRDYSDAPVISPWHWGQYQISSWPAYPRLLNSGVIAGWVAYLMGAHPVIFAGFDCYGGKVGAMDMHKTMLAHMPCEVRVCSGPLLKFIKQYDPAEVMEDYKMPDVHKAAGAGQIRVRVDRPFHYRGYDWPIGSILTVGEHEVKLQLKHKSLSIVPDDPKPVETAQTVVKSESYAKPDRKVKKKGGKS